VEKMAAFLFAAKPRWGVIIGLPDIGGVCRSVSRRNLVVGAAGEMCMDGIQVKWKKWLPFYSRQSPAGA
jgi:hypothetical protein